MNNNTSGQLGLVHLCSLSHLLSDYYYCDETASPCEHRILATVDGDEGNGQNDLLLSTTSKCSFHMHAFVSDHHRRRRPRYLFDSTRLVSDPATFQLSMEKRTRIIFGWMLSSSLHCLDDASHILNAYCPPRCLDDLSSLFRPCAVFRFDWSSPA